MGVEIFQQCRRLWWKSPTNKSVLFDLGAKVSSKSRYLIVLTRSLMGSRAIPKNLEATVLADWAAHAGKFITRK